MALATTAAMPARLLLASLALLAMAPMGVMGIYCDDDNCYEILG